MSRLVRLSASNLLKVEVITAVGDNLTLFSFATNKVLKDENLGKVVILGVCFYFRRRA